MLALFDFDGTLADTLDLIGQLYNSHASEYGSKAISRGELPKLRKMSYRRAMKQKGIKIWVLPRIVSMVRREIKDHIEEIEPYDGVIKMLQNLKSSDVEIAILTSSTKEFVNDYLQLKKFPEFEFIIYEKKLFGKQKAIRKILKTRGLSNTEILYIGDEPRDVVACRKAKIDMIGVSWGLGGREALLRHGTEAVVDTADQLEAEILKRAG